MPAVKKLSLQTRRVCMHNVCTSMYTTVLKVVQFYFSIIQSAVGMSDVEIHLSDLQDIIEVYMYIYSVLKMH